jgi:hypothetical protein
MTFLALAKLAIELLAMSLQDSRDADAEERALFALIREAHDQLARSRLK